MSKQESLPCFQHQAFTLRHHSARMMSFSSGTRNSASRSILRKADANSDVIARFNLYSENLPFGVLWPAVVLPPQLSMKTFMWMYNK